MPLLVIPNPLSPNDHKVMHGEWQIGQINPALSGALDGYGLSTAYPVEHPRAYDSQA